MGAKLDDENFGDEILTHTVNKVVSSIDNLEPKTKSEIDTMVKKPIFKEIIESMVNGTPNKDIEYLDPKSEKIIEEINNSQFMYEIKNIASEYNIQKGTDIFKDIEKNMLNGANKEYLKKII